MHRFLTSAPSISVCVVGALSGIGCGEHKITSHNSKPEATITDPTPDDRLVENIPYVVMGQVDDDDEAADSLTTHWRIGTRDACTDVVPSADGSTQCELTMLADLRDPRGAVIPFFGHDAYATTYPAMVATAPSWEIASMPASRGRMDVWLLLGMLALGLVVVLLLGRRLRRHPSMRPVIVVPADDEPMELPDEPAEALRELKRRGGDHTG